MKFRDDYVTNSSSSSFIIKKKHLTDRQIMAIKNHRKIAGRDCWNIDENEEYIEGDTYMDNFDMWEFLKKIGVNMDKVAWSEFSFDIDDPEIENVF